MAPELAADFIERFGVWWAAPDPATLGSLLSPDVVLVQPFLPTAEGLPAAQRTFRRLIRALPDLTGTVHRWGAHGDAVFIEFALSGSLGGKSIGWQNLDRFILDAHGLALERVNLHDSLALVGKMISRPRGWGRILRSGLLSRR